jgi:selenide,water dikinase
MRPWRYTKKLGQLRKLIIENEKQRHILCDPQTSGGLLIAVKKRLPKKWNQFKKSKGLNPIGELIEKSESLVYIK